MDASATWPGLSTTICCSLLARQVTATYNTSLSTNAQTYNASSSVKVYSQDFQTVFIDNDLYGHNEVHPIHVHIYMCIGDSQTCS